MQQDFQKLLNRCATAVLFVRRYLNVSFRHGLGHTDSKYMTYSKIENCKILNKTEIFQEYEYFRDDYFSIEKTSLTLRISPV